MTLAARQTAAAVVLGTLTSACAPASAPHDVPAPAVRVYVSNETAGSVVVVDPATGAVEHSIAVGKRPRGLKFSRDRRVLFVALSGSPIAPPGVDESTLPRPIVPPTASAS